MPLADAIRFAHLSDIHVTTRPLGWRLRDLLTKRATGWVITEQVRTVSASRLTGRGPVYRLRPEQVAEVRRVLRQMLDL